MKIISNKELEKLHPKRKGGEMTSKILFNARSLKLNQVLFIELNEWKKLQLKTEFASYVMTALRKVRTNKKFSVRSFDEGWSITRIK